MVFPVLWKRKKKFLKLRLTENLGVVGEVVSLKETVKEVFEKEITFKVDKRVSF